MRKVLLLLGVLMITSLSTAYSYPRPYNGYCYSDCRPCWSGNGVAACPDHSSCTQIPLC
jgi:hypothetical protein